MFDRTLYERVVAEWEAHQAAPRHGREVLPPPDVGDVRAIIDAMFVASLSREEGRLLRFTACLISPERVREITSARAAKKWSPQQVIQQFDTPIPLSATALAKLAPAFDVNASALMVAPVAKEGDVPQIWGGMHYGEQGQEFFGPGEVALRIPDAMFCTTRSPGSIVVTRQTIHIGSIVLGELIPRQPSPFIEHAIGKYLLNLLCDNRSVAEAKSLLYDVYIQALSQLLRFVSERGHGASIIIIPSAKQGFAKSLTTTKYPFTCAFRMSECTEDVRATNARRSHKKRETVLENLRIRLAAVAQLACIDGALLLTPELEPISFATTLRAEKWSGTVLTGPSLNINGPSMTKSRGGDSFPVRSLGTRHNSTVDFVGACDGAVGFVVSADGPVRGFVRRDPHVILCWPDCRQSVHAWHMGS
jgi:hypothetical protein